MFDPAPISIVPLTVIVPPPITPNTLTKVIVVLTSTGTLVFATYNAPIEPWENKASIVIRTEPFVGVTVNVGVVVTVGV